MTAKQLEQETGCKIMVRGKGSMRDKKKVRSLFCVQKLWTSISVRISVKFLLNCAMWFVWDTKTPNYHVAISNATRICCFTYI